MTLHALRQSLHSNGTVTPADSFVQFANDRYYLHPHLNVWTDTDGSVAAEQETMFVTDQMIRWDNTGAPQFVLRGPFNVGGLGALVFVPGTT